VIESLTARLRGADEHLQVGARLTLPDELGEHERPQ
jgi:hypothetical protein